MAVKRCESNIDVVKAAEIRIKNVFGNGLPVFFSFSGGKDSLCLAQLMVNLANRGEINMKQLTVQFIDEEAIFPCMEEMTKKWRRIFMMMLYNADGVPFAQVSSFQSKTSFNNTKYQPLGQNRELETNNTIGVTITISEIVVLDGELFNNVVSAVNKGERAKRRCRLKQRRKWLIFYCLEIRVWAIT